MPCKPQITGDVPRFSPPPFLLSWLSYVLLYTTFLTSALAVNAYAPTPITPASTNADRPAIFRLRLAKVRLPLRINTSSPLFGIVDTGVSFWDRGHWRVLRGANRRTLRRRFRFVSPVACIFGSPRGSGWCPGPPRTARRDVESLRCCY